MLPGTSGEELEWALRAQAATGAQAIIANLLDGPATFIEGQSDLEGTLGCEILSAGR